MLFFGLCCVKERTFDWAGHLDNGIGISRPRDDRHLAVAERTKNGSTTLVAFTAKRRSSEWALWGPLLLDAEM